MDFHFITPGRRAGSNEPQVYATYVRPDGRYKIVIYRRPVLFGMMPGQAGDAPGVVKLFDQSGKELAETNVEMVQNVERVEWLPRHVRIKLVAEWDLPN